MPKSKIETCKFIPISALLPRGWIKWFFDGGFCEQTPFTWGGNDRSLVSADRFADYLEECIDVVFEDTPKMRRFLCKLRKLKKLYLDLES